MKTQHPEVKLSIAEKVIRGIAKREGEGIKKRRAGVEILGNGYMVFDPGRNVVLAGGIGPGHDGCNCTLEDVASRYEECEKNTAWQKLVIASIKAGKIA